MSSEVVQPKSPGLGGRKEKLGLVPQEVAAPRGPRLHSPRGGCETVAAAPPGTAEGNSNKNEMAFKQLLCAKRHRAIAFPGATPQQPCRRGASVPLGETQRFLLPAQCIQPGSAS